MPTSFSISGSYNDSATNSNTTSQLFNGAITATWNNPMNNPNIATVSGSVNIQGTVTQGQYVPYQLNTTLSFDGNGNVSCTFTNITFGPETFTGSLSGTVNAQGNISNATLKLTDQNGVTINLTNNLTAGTVTQAGTQEATITPGASHTASVVFTDGTTVIIPL